MKVLLINGSPHKNGCTYTALRTIADQLALEGIDSEIAWIGNGAVRGCIACGACHKDGADGCAFRDDVMYGILEKAKEADGFVFGSPVYYASANGSMISLMDRLFQSGGKYFAGKPAASVVSARRAGTSATYDELNKYIGYMRMIMVPSPYWNMVHGATPEDVLKDEEGITIMKNIGCGLAWLLKLIELGKKNGLGEPNKVPMARTNFIKQ